MSLKLVFILANSADPDEMLHCAAFHLGLHCFPKYPFRGFQYTKGVPNLQTVMLENCEEPTEMLQIPAFYQGIHCSLKTKTIIWN